ncbi:hypothetical protein P7K49_028214 [Saguinus oedipus]|uniref:Uncharacterized protein n=1 Tax=Saguinus oedipus TaxID=9490 RepID=A0ABQ9UC32_SAGOE|nr:hypothetical protein P7K49_028214 [Saguinus oedipus]
MSTAYAALHLPRGLGCEDSDGGTGSPRKLQGRVSTNTRRSSQLRRGGAEMPGSGAGNGGGRRKGRGEERPGRRKGRGGSRLTRARGWGLRVWVRSDGKAVKKEAAGGD